MASWAIINNLEVTSLPILLWHYVLLHSLYLFLHNKLEFFNMSFYCPCHPSRSRLCTFPNGISNSIKDTTRYSKAPYQNNFSIWAASTQVQLSTNLNMGTNNYLYTETWFSNRHWKWNSYHRIQVWFFETCRLVHTPIPPRRPNSINWLWTSFPPVNPGKLRIDSMIWGRRDQMTKENTYISYFRILKNSEDVLTPKHTLSLRKQDIFIL